MKHIISCVFILLFLFVLPNTTYATFCIPTFFTGKIVVAKFESYETRCTDIYNENIELNFETKASLWGMPKSFSIESIQHSYQCYSKLDTHPDTQTIGDPISGLYTFKVGNIYAMKLNKYDQGYNFGLCNGEVREVASVTDQKVISMIMSTLGNNILLGYFALPFIIVSPLGNIGIPESVVSNLGFILHLLILILFIYIIIRSILRKRSKLKKD